MTITFNAHTLYGLSTDTKPTDVDVNRLFLETDTLLQYLFDGADWNLLPSGGVTGLNPNSTILEHSTDIEDYTTPTDATATSEQPAVSDYDHAGDAGGSFSFLCGSGCDGTRIGILLSTGFSGLGNTVNAIRWRLEKVGTPTGTVTVAIRNSVDAIKASGTFDVSTIPTSPSFEEKEVVLSAPVILAQDDRVTVEFSGGDNTNYLLVRKSTAANDTNTSYQLFNGSWANSGANAGAVTFDSGTNSALSAIDGDTATFWRSQAGVNESITLDMGSVVNCYGLAYYLSTGAGMTETQFQINSVVGASTLFADNYTSSAGWSIEGTAISINSGVAGHAAAINSLGSNEDRAFQGLGGTLSDTEWYCELDMEVQTTTSVNGSQGLLVCFTSGSGKINTTTDLIGIRTSQLTGGTSTLGILYKDGAGSITTSSPSTAFATGTQKWLTFKRTSSTSVVLEIYDDIDRTSLFDTVTQNSLPATVIGLDTIQHSFEASDTSRIYWQIDSILIYNNTTVIPTPTIDKTLRTISTADLTLDAWNYIRFNGVNTQNIQIRGSSGNSLVMAANELALLTEADPPLTTLHGQFDISENDDTLPLDGGDPTNFMVLNSLVNQITFNNVATPNDPELEKGLLWVETTDAENNSLKLKIKSDNVIKEFDIAGGGITGLNPNSTILEYSTDIADYNSPPTATATSEDGANVAVNAVNGSTADFWKSDAGINESIAIDMGSNVNMYGLAFYIDKVQTGITETEFQIKTASTTNPTFSDDFVYATQGGANLVWVPQNDANNSRVDIVAEELEWTIDRASTNKNILVDLTSVSDTQFFCRFHWTVPSLTLGSSAGKFGAFGFFGSDGATTFATLQNALFLRVAFSTSAGEDDYRTAEADNENLTSGASTLFTETISAGDDFYMEFIRNSATDFEINFYSDPAYTVLVESRSLTTAAITGLQYFGIKTNSDAGATAGAGIGTIDDFIFYDGVNSLPPVTVGATLRTILVSDLVDQSYNYIRFNGANAQTLVIEGSSGNSLIMAANDLQVQRESDPPLTTLHGQFTINGTNSSLALNGGDPTSSVIDDPQINTLTLNNVATPNNPETGKAVLWVETVDADNDGVFAKIKVDGTFKTVRVI